VRIERIRTQEQIAVQEQEVQRKQKELEATVIKAAEAERQAAILRAEAAKVRAEWAYEDEWEARNRILISTAEGAALKRTLLDDAIWRRPAPPRLDIGWADQAFDQTQ